MYYRNIRPSLTKTENDVPVQYFGDSFSADVFKNKNENITESISSETEDNGDLKASEQKIGETKASPLGKDIDNLLLLGLIFLFLTDCECKEDIIIPVLLGVILLS